jgi:hypothetical protein
LPKTPERRAGASDLAGFIDAPEMKARKKMSRPTFVGSIAAALICRIKFCNY